MKIREYSIVVAVSLAFLPLISCTSRGRIDDVIKGFFGEVNRSNFESAKTNYLTASLINELNAPPALWGSHKTIQKSFQPAAGSIDSVEVTGEVVKGEEATATVTLVISWGAKESGTIDLIKEQGKAWKIKKWTNFRALGSEHLANAGNWCAARNLGAAVPEYQAALAENPQDSMILTNLGMCYQGIGRLDDAEAQFKKAIEMHPNAVWDAYIKLGSLYALRGDTAKAEEVFQKAIKNKPDDARGYNSLAWMYADKGIKLDKAIELARKATELAPDDGAIVDTLGWAYYRKGLRTEALRYLSRAVARAPDLAEIRNHYEEVSTTAAVHLDRAQHQMNSGRFDQASGECDAALRQEPNNAQAKSLRAAIGKEAATRHVAGAMQLFERQQYDPALSECDAALRYDPQNADATNLKAKIAETKKVLGYR
jgi:tetratricopeptide (TPR) repeat protein